MPSLLDLRTLAALIAAVVAFGTLVAGETPVLTAAAMLVAAALAVSLAWRD